MAVFKDQISRTNTNGGVFYCTGEFTVFVDRIGEDAPQDWALGPKMRPGEFGAFLAHGFYPSGHSPYAFATAPTAAGAMAAAQGGFRERISEWRNLEDRNV